MATEEDLNNWMNDIDTAVAALPGGKGIVSAIQPPHTVETKFGVRKALYVVIQGSDNSTISVKVFLPEAYPKVHPKSNLAKIMAYYGCEKLQELLGKEVKVSEVGEGLWKIDSE